MSWVLGLGVLVVLVFGPTLWVRWVMVRHGEELPNMPGTGGELAEHLVSSLGLSGVGVEVTEFGDHYDPLERKVRLTEDKFNGKSLTAIAVAAHEVGHAMQHHQGDVRLLVRTKLVPLADRVARVGSAFMWAAPVIGILTRHPMPFWVLVLAGLSGLIMRMLVHLVTLPIEWDASFGKALPVLTAGNYVPQRERQVVKKILRAAALTYVAAAMADVLNLARWTTILLRR